MHAWAARAALIGLLALRESGIEPHVRVDDPYHTPIAALWERPGDIAQRDLFAGSTRGTRPPRIDRPLTFLSGKAGGFSRGYDVRDANGREWTVKIGEEAQTEVVASRLVWAIGYHQPPTYFVECWSLVGGPQTGPQPPARFRPKDARLESTGVWSWQHNPFVGTAPYRLLLATMLLLNSTDLKTGNNIVYRVNGSEPREWYVVRDLGATLGETGVYRPSRNDIDAFEDEPFLRIGEDGITRFGFRGLQKELLRSLTAADLRALAAAFGQLSNAQWNDAFRAAGYDAATTARYVSALRNRLASAARADDGFDGRDSDYWGSRHLPALARQVARAPRLLASLSR